MNPPVTLTLGQQFRDWTVIGFSKIRTRSAALCRCVCDAERVVLNQNLLSGLSQSCGCLNTHRAVEHGHTKRGWKSPTHSSWGSMLQRCLNPHTRAYRHYGAKGVRVCKRWMTFVNFVADMGERPASTSLGRLLDIGDYKLGNCRWMTAKEQGMERRKKNVLRRTL